VPHRLHPELPEFTWLDSMGTAADAMDVVAVVLFVPLQLRRRIVGTLSTSRQSRSSPVRCEDEREPAAG
jgi:hypothetical protein